MVTGFIGADVDRLRLLADHFLRGAEELTQLAQRLSHQVADDSSWAGSDCDDFRGQWDTDWCPALFRVVQVLLAAAESLRRNADEQERASAGDTRFDRLRVLDLNIGMGYEYRNRDLPDHGMQPHEIRELADLVIEQRADIATFQEWHDVPGLRDRLEAELERRTGRDWELHFTHNLDAHDAKAGYDYAAAGTLVAVQLGDGIRAVHTDLPEHPLGVNSNVRGVQIETANGGLVNVYDAHIPTERDEDGRRDGDLADQIERLGEIAQRDNVPSIIAGDFNRRMGEGEAGEVLAGYQDAGFTDVGQRALPDGVRLPPWFAGPLPTHDAGRIDYIFAEEGIRFVPGSTRVFEGDPHGDGAGSNLTDHDGLVTEIDVPTNR